jgi:hypothetical protein
MSLPSGKILNNYARGAQANATGDTTVPIFIVNKFKKGKRESDLHSHG